MKNIDLSKFNRFYRPFSAGVLVLVGIGLASWGLGSLGTLAFRQRYVTMPQAQIYLPTRFELVKNVPRGSQDPSVVAGGDASEGPVDLNDAEYDVVVKVLKDLITTQDPMAAMYWLDSAQKWNPKIARSCHGLAHEMGRNTYKKYQNFTTAMSYQADICANGYVHGVVEQHFAQVTDVYAEMNRVCLDGNVSCLHAIGHGLMYFNNNDVPIALAQCAGIAAAGGSALCSEGIFHENYETNSKEHSAKYLNPEDPYGLCRMGLGYESSCYYYASRYVVRVNNDNYPAALAYCLNAPGGEQYTCSRGVGSILVRQNINDAPLVLGNCLQAPNGSLINGCIYGATMYYQVNIRSAWGTKTGFCDKLDGSYYTNLCNSFIGMA